MCGLRTRRGAGKLVPAEMRSKEWWMMKRNYVFLAIIERDKKAVNIRLFSQTCRAAVSKGRILSRLITGPGPG
ncbi:MAG: hypothetical protein NHB14_25205 [Desulfosporosinus sp.]|nr:hypothetical protein [Desulfosporosinus sp.]